MRDESFGPVIGIMSVSSDEEAIALMNDSPFGLTCSMWTQEIAAAERIGNQLETGTVFMNRCDALDKAVWVGQKSVFIGHHPQAAAALQQFARADAGELQDLRRADRSGGEHHLARRVLRMASEDIGLADPRGLQLALQAAEVYERLGSPEGELALAQAVVYLAVAAKSNAVYTAYNAVREFVAQDGSRPVPMHLRNAPTRLMEKLGYGKGYRYAHDEPEAYAAGESYFPEGMPAVEWYRPTDRGLEARIREKLEALRSRDRAAKEPK